MADSYREVAASLRRAYDAMVDERERREVPPWKQEARARFLELVQAEGRTTMLEVGAGTGVHGRFFAEAGLDVVCTDLSPAMVEACRAKGLVAHERDFLDLDLGRTFAVAFAMNCLLHVPPGDLPAALASIGAVLDPGGLMYLGQYGGIDRAGVLADDGYEPKRYFSWLTDERLLSEVGRVFDVVDFRIVDIGGAPGMHFQSVVLRKPSGAAS